MPSQAPVYTFDTMIASLRKAMKGFPDARTGKNTQYEVMDAASGAFSVFFTQCPSFLSHQKMLQQKHGLSNARTLFGMKRIPSDNQIRNLLDGVDPSCLSCVFTDCLGALAESGDLDTYRIPLGSGNNDLLLALDGTTYFSSSDCSCKNCSTKVKDGQKLYAHSMVTPTIVAPGINKVISLLPSFITPQDGDTKQDCELKASKRWIDNNGDMCKKLGITFLGDDLYSHEPFCRKLLTKGNFILVCKPDSHKTVYEWVKGVTKQMVHDRFDGKKHMIYTYNYAESVPLRDTIKKEEPSLLVNFVEVIVTDRKTGKQLYHNAFVTNHPLTEKTLPLIVDCGRARWKIENENNNTLKTAGYHLEHNFGHGKKYLASLLATMNILAFLFHTMLEFMDKKYQLLRKIIGARKQFFHHIKILLIYHPYTNFDHLMDFMLEGLKKPFPIEDLHYPL
jgi:hypothetical protein